MGRAAVVALVALGFALVACQAVVGEDFSEKVHYCDPLTSQFCGTGAGCYFVSATVVGCFAAGGVDEGGSCSSETDCVAGLTCGGFEGVFACRRHCRNNGECPSLSCVSFAPPRVIDGVQFGACGP